MTEDSNAGKRDDATPNKPEKAAKKPAGKPVARGDAKPSERIAKVLARAGLASRREVERLIGLGKIAVNGRILDTPAVLVKASDVITVDGQVIGKAEPTRLWRYHKPVGLVTTHRDPEGRSTVFDKLPAGLPRVISVGRLDLNSEGLLLLTNDGELARSLEKPSSGWVRRYRARALGHTTQARLDRLKDGTTVDGVIYGPMEASLDKVSEKADGRANVWLTVSITEGKNREVRKVLESIGLKVNRLIRLAYGPFQLGNLESGDVEEVGPRVIRELLGEVIELRNLPPEGASQTRTPGRASRDATAADGKPVGRRAGGDRFAANRGEEAGRKSYKPRRTFDDRREFSKDRDFDERPRFEGDGETRDRKPQREFKPRRDFGGRPKDGGPQGERQWTPRAERGEGQMKARPERSERPAGERSFKGPRKDFGDKPRPARGERPERSFKPRRNLDEAGAYERAKAEFGPGAKAGAKKPYRPRGEGGATDGSERKWTPRAETGERKWTPRPEGRERGRAPRGEGGEKPSGAKRSFGSKPGGKPFAGKSTGKPQGSRPFGGKPSGPRKPKV